MQLNLTNCSETKFLTQEETLLTNPNNFTNKGNEYLPAFFNEANKNISSPNKENYLLLSGFEEKNPMAFKSFKIQYLDKDSKFAILDLIISSQYKLALEKIEQELESLNTEQSILILWLCKFKNDKLVKQIENLVQDQNANNNPVFSRNNNQFDIFLKDPLGEEALENVFRLSSEHQFFPLYAFIQNYFINGLLAQVDLKFQGTSLKIMPLLQLRVSDVIFQYRQNFIIP